MNIWSLQLNGDHGDSFGARLIWIEGIIFISNAFRKDGRSACPGREGDRDEQSEEEDEKESEWVDCMGGLISIEYLLINALPLQL